MQTIEDVEEYARNRYFELDEYRRNNKEKINCYELDKLRVRMREMFLLLEFIKHHE